MKPCLKLFLALLAAIAFASSPAQAGDEQKMVIELETDSFKLDATDVSSLAVGESKTIETESGQVIDILRTLDEYEIYIDGELIDFGLPHDPEGQLRVIRKHMKVVCDEEDENECGKHLVIHTSGDEELTTWISTEDDDVFVHKDIEITCSDDSEDGEEINCEQYVVVTTGDGEVEIESILDEYEDGKGHKVIVITSETDSND